MIGLPLAGLIGLVAIAPPLPRGLGGGSGTAYDTSSGEPFRTHTDAEAYALDFDPRRVQVDLLVGWDREQEAFGDGSALAFISGPMYERHVDAGGREITVPLGDLKLGERVWRGRNRTAALQRAFIGIRPDGRVDFGYGELTAERARLYDTFIGGLHSLYNDLEAPPAAYRGAYGISMGQQIRYHLPRIRVVMGLRADGRVEVLMSRDGLTLEQTKALARQRQLLAAYLPDHASKSRFILPGRKGFSQEDANWISGGATSFVHVPYMLRLSERPYPLRGSLLTALAPPVSGGNCASLLGCGPKLGSQLLDRAMAGFNRLMEQGVEPIARLIWAPSGPRSPKRQDLRAPLREPPITADPMALRQRQEQPPQEPEADSSQDPPDLPVDLPPPLVLPEGQTLPAEGTADGQQVPSEETSVRPATPPPPPDGGAPPPPLLPPPPVSP